MNDPNATHSAAVNPYDLEQFDQDFNTAKFDETSAGEPLPDGKFQMLVEKAELVFSKKNNPMMVWQMRVLGPRYAGHKHWHRNMIISKENIKWLKHDLMIAGLEIEKLSQLPAHLNKLLDVVLEVQLKTKGDNQNSFINKRITQNKNAVEVDPYGDVRF